MIKEAINFHNTNIFRETQIRPLSYSTKKFELLQFDYLNSLLTEKEKEKINFFFFATKLTWFVVSYTTHIHV